MKIEIGGHTVSRKEFAVGTAMLIGAPIFLFGAKAIAEQLTQDQLREQEEREQQQKIANENKDNYLSGEAVEIFLNPEVYAH